MTDHYAEAYFIAPGRCFRMVHKPGEGQPTHCPDPPRARGDWIDATGKRWHGVEACSEHEEQLVPPRVRLISAQ